MPAGTPIDLDNCAREPIHIPGSVQPRGVLAVVREPAFEVRQVSANVADLLGRPVDAVLGRHLSTLIGSEQSARVEQAAAGFGSLRQNNPLEFTIEVAGEPRAFDASLQARVLRRQGYCRSRAYVRAVERFVCRSGSSTGQASRWRRGS